MFEADANLVSLKLDLASPPEQIQTNLNEIMSTCRHRL